MEKTDQFEERPSLSTFIPKSKMKWNFKSHLAFIISTSVLLVFITLVIGLFLLPTIFYYYIDDSSHSLTQFDPGASGTSTLINTSTSTGNICTGVALWSEETAGDSCNLQQYEGTVCRDILWTWELCALGTGSVQLLASIDVGKWEMELNNLKAILDTLASDTCKEAVLPFLCQHYFKLGSCSTGKSLVSSQEECYRISQDVCKQEWAVALSLGYGAQLPQCEQLPLGSNVSRELVNITDARYSSAANASTSLNLTCKEDFVEIDYVCQPRCDRFMSNSKAVTYSVLVIQIVLAVIGLIVASGILIISFIRFRVSLKFPSFYVLIVVIDYTLAAGMIIIAAFDRYSLFCNSISLIESIKHSTPFCMISGAVFHYTIVNMTVLWCFHISLFLFQRFWPQTYLNVVGTRSWYVTNVLLTLGGFVLPLISVIVSLAMEKHNYHIVQFPPSLCLSDGTMWFYSVTLPLSLLLASGTILLMLVVWKQCQSPCDNSIQELSACDRSSLIYFITFLIFGIAVLLLGTLVDAFGDETIDNLRNYFLCETAGYTPGKCSRDEIENPLISLVYLTVTLLMAAVPVAAFFNVVALTKANTKQVEASA